MLGGGQVDVINTDFAKAFDRIDQAILLRKLSKFQLDPCIIKLIQSYLENRTQIVCVGGVKSMPIVPKSSVPQGSIISPLLFALFINDLPPLLKSKALLFADDLKIFRKICSLDDARALQDDLNTIHCWCIANNLQLNIGKCCIMSLTRKLHINMEYFNYNIRGISLNRVGYMKDLGVIFDSKLSFEPHINYITKRAYAILGFIMRSLNRFHKLQTYKILYFTYVRSILEYCSSVWNPHYAIHINNIERVQKRFTRFIYRKFHCPNELYYEMRYVRLDLLSLENRRLIADEMTLFKILSLRLKCDLINNVHSNTRTRQTRQNNIFFLPTVTTNVEYFSPLIRFQRNHDNIFSNVNLTECWGI